MASLKFPKISTLYTPRTSTLHNGFSIGESVVKPQKSGPLRGKQPVHPHERFSTRHINPSNKIEHKELNRAVFSRWPFEEISDGFCDIRGRPEKEEA